MRWRMIFVVALCVIFLHHAAHAKTIYQFQLEKNVESISVVEENQRMVFVVHSSFGIGKARIILASGQWPKHIALRFLYRKDEGFKYLEQIEITTARLKVIGSEQTSGKMEFYLPDEDGKFASEPAGTANIVTERSDKAMDVLLPAHLFTGSKEVSLYWIDAFRQ